MLVKRVWPPVLATMTVSILLILCLLIWVSPGEAAENVVVPDSASVVPLGKVLEVKFLDEKAQVERVYYLDPHTETCVQMVLGGACPPFGSLLVSDSLGHSEIDGVTLDVYEGGLTYAIACSRIDSLAGKTVTCEGQAEVEGRNLMRIKGSREVGAGETVPVLGYLDPETGIVVREEVSVGSATLIITRELIDPAAREYAAVDRRTLGDIADSLFKSRLATLTSFYGDSPVLAEGKHGLSLMWIMPSSGWSYVRLEYELTKNPGRPAAAVKVWDLQTRGDYPARYLAQQAGPLVEKWEDGERASFRTGNTGIQLQVDTELLAVGAVELAQELVPVEAAFAGTIEGARE